MGLQWDYSFPRSPNGEKSSSMYYIIWVFKTKKNEMGWASSIRMMKVKFFSKNDIKF
jgi:hypothetical protein